MIHEPYGSDHSAKAYVAWRERSLLRRLSKRLEAWRVLREAGDAKRLLDMPCGGGRFSALASCDRAPGMVRLAYERGARAVLGDAFALPFAADAFDAVVCVRLLHHFEEQEVRDLLREMCRVAPRAVVTYFGTRGLKARRRRRKGGRGTRRALAGERFAFLCGEEGWTVGRDVALLPGYSEQRIARLDRTAPRSAS